MFDIRIFETKLNLIQKLFRVFKYSRFEFKEMDDQNKDNNEKDLGKELEECHKLCEEYLNGWKRAKADLINYKKEESQHLAEIGKYARQNFIYQLLPMLDNLDLTVKHMPAELMENNNVKGLLMIKTQLEDLLKANGVAAVESAGKNFDPNLHEVIQAVEDKDCPSGTIIEEVQKGYMIEGNLLRPAKVKVAK